MTEEHREILSWPEESGLEVSLGSGVGPVESLRGQRLGWRSEDPEVDLPRNSDVGRALHQDLELHAGPLGDELL